MQTLISEPYLCPCSKGNVNGFLSPSHRLDGFTKCFSWLSSLSLSVLSVPETTINALSTNFPSVHPFMSHGKLLTLHTRPALSLAVVLYRPPPKPAREQSSLAKHINCSWWWSLSKPLHTISPLSSLSLLSSDSSPLPPFRCAAKTPSGAPVRERRNLVSLLALPFSPTRSLEDRAGGNGDFLERFSLSRVARSEQRRRRRRRKKPGTYVTGRGTAHFFFSLSARDRLQLKPRATVKRYGMGSLSAATWFESGKSVL